MIKRFITKVRGSFYSLTKKTESLPAPKINYASAEEVRRVTEKSIKEIGPVLKRLSYE